MGLHVAGTANDGSWRMVDVLSVSWTAERMATSMTDWGTCYAATSCTKGAHPVVDLARYVFCYPHYTGIEAFQRYSMKSIDSTGNCQSCPLNREINYCCRSRVPQIHPLNYSSRVGPLKTLFSLNRGIHEQKKRRLVSDSV